MAQESPTAHTRMAAVASTDETTAGFKRKADERGIVLSEVNMAKEEDQLFLLFGIADDLAKKIKLRKLVKSLQQQQQQQQPNENDTVLEMAETEQEPQRRFHTLPPPDEPQLWIGQTRTEALPTRFLREQLHSFTHVGSCPVLSLL